MPQLNEEEEEGFEPEEVPEPDTPMEPSELDQAEPDNALPEVREEETEVIEFIWSKNGKLQRVEIRAPSWGRAEESQKGLRVREYSAVVDGEETTIRDYDAGSLASRPEVFFRSYVASINGHLWTRAKTVKNLDASWVNEFMRVAAPRVGTVLEDGRKKSRSR